MENDLRVCKVKELTDLDRRFTFEIFSPKWYVFLLSIEAFNNIYYILVDIFYKLIHNVNVITG